jgi:hypothetical protein
MLFKNTIKNNLSNKLYLNLLILAVLFPFGRLFPQNVPPNKIPSNAVIRYYPLDDTNVNDIRNNKNGTKHGSFQAVLDRWGKPSGALQINNNNSYVELPNFFEGADITNGYSISFWMKVDDTTGAPSGSDLPYLPSDRRDQIFFARKGSISSGNTLFGMRRIRDRLVVNRYIPNQRPTKELEFWFWDRANLVPYAGTGSDWHFVTLVYTKNAMQVYVGSPNGGFECRANYFAPQNLSEATLWGIGNPDGSSIKYLDEFTVYSIPITELQAKDLFETSRAFNLHNTYSIVPVHSGKPMSVANSGMGENQNIEQRSIQIDDDNQQWYIQRSGGNLFHIQSRLSGRYLDVSGSSTSDGASIVQKEWNNHYSQEWWIQHTGTNSNGDYYRITNRNSYRELDVYGGSNADGANIIQWPENQGNNQKWHISPKDTPLMIDEGEYYIVSKKYFDPGLDQKYGRNEIGAWTYVPSRQVWKLDYHKNGRYKIALAHKQDSVLAISYQASTLNQPVVTSFSYKRNQYWRFIKMGEDHLPYYRIVNYKSTQNLHCSSSWLSSNYLVDQSNFNNDEKEYWYLIPKSYFTLNNGQYRIRAKHSGAHLKANTVQDDAEVGEFNVENTKWDIERLTDGYYRITLNGKPLMTADDGYTANIVLGDYFVDDYKYKWIFRKLETVGGITYYTIINAKKSGLMQVQNGSTSEGANINIGYYDDKPEQMWYLEVVDNNKCKNAVTINCGQTISGTTANFTRDNIDICGSASNQYPNTPSVWYRLTNIQPNTTVTVTTCSNNTNFDTQLGVYKASSTCGLMECVTGNDDASGERCGQYPFYQSKLTFTTDNNMEKDYFIVVFGYSSSGEFELRVDCPISGSPLSAKAANVMDGELMMDINEEDKEINPNISIDNFAPNPADAKQTSINVNVKDHSQMGMVFYNLAGVNIMGDILKLKPGENHLNLNLDKLSPGIYIVQFNIGGHKISRKLIIK